MGVLMGKKLTILVVCFVLVILASCSVPEKSETKVIIGKEVQPKEHVLTEEKDQIQSAQQVSSSVVIPPTMPSAEEDQVLGIEEDSEAMSKLGLKKGYRYRYMPIQEGTGIYQDMYVTDETDDIWKGIIATVIGDKVTFQHFELDKKSLIPKSSENVRKSEVMDEAKLYPERRGEGMLAFFMLDFQQKYNFNLSDVIAKGSKQIQYDMVVTHVENVQKQGYNTHNIRLSESYPGQTKESDVFVSIEKPYILVENQDFRLVDIEKKDFLISEYEQYESYPAIPKLGQFTIASYELKTDGTMVLELVNNLLEDSEVTYFIVGTQVTNVNQILPAQSSKQFSFATGQTGSAGQEYSVFVEIRFKDPEKEQISTSSMEFNGIYGEKKEYGE